MTVHDTKTYAREMFHYVPGVKYTPELGYGVREGAFRATRK
jgi:hypothetical protein